MCGIRTAIERRCIYDTWIVNIAIYEIDETHGREEESHMKTRMNV